MLELIPLDRILTETDHPFGDRRGGRQARPGLVTDVEHGLAKRYGRTDDEIRLMMWDNLARLIRQTGSAALLPRPVRVQLMAL